MKIDNGGYAIVLFPYIARNKYDSEQEKQIKGHLLEYCKLDTLAMVRVSERLNTLSQ